MKQADDMLAETGSLSVLNVGAGDITISFNPDAKDEVDKALRMLNDMKQRGYLIAVQLPDGSYTRAVEIDAAHARYVVTVPEDTALPADAELGQRRRRGRPPGRGQKRVGVPIATSRAVGVARSAGG